MSVAERVATALGPGITALAGPLLPDLVGGLTGELESTDVLLEPVDGQPGTPLSNLTTTPYPRWIGQVAGVNAPASYTDGQVRALVAGASAAKRGTPGAMIAAVRATLTGQQRVRLVERDGDAYSVSLVTYTPETPDSAATLAAALTQKPVGLILSYIASPGQVYAQTTAEGKTYAEHSATGRTYTDRSLVLP